MYEYLSQHPDICMSSEKETRFFSDPEYYEKGEEWLRGFFAHYADETAIGEGDPGTMHKPGSAKRVKDTIPEANLIFIVRDPVEYMHAIYHFGVRLGIFDCGGRTFSEFIRDESNKWSRICREKPNYLHHIKKFESRFGRERIKVVVFDEFVSDTENVMGKVCSFLGVEPEFDFRSERHNATKHVAHPRLYRGLYRLWEPLKEAFGSRLPAGAENVKNSVRGLFFSAQAERPQMSEEDRKYLQDLYREPSQRFEEWLGRELPDHWP
jgi:hypothetical protein